MCSAAAAPHLLPLLFRQAQTAPPDSDSRLAILGTALGSRPARAALPPPTAAPLWFHSSRRPHTRFPWQQNRIARSPPPAAAHLLWRYGRLRFVRLPARCSWRTDEIVPSLRGSQSQTPAARVAHAPVVFSPGGISRPESVAPLLSHIRPGIGPICILPCRGAPYRRRHQ
jgi:hypothetical protein